MSGMTITATTSGGDVLVLFNTTVHHAADNATSEYALFVDSSEEFSIRSEFRQGYQPETISMSYLVTGLSAGSHTFEIHWRSEIGWTVQQLAATWGNGRNMVIMEVTN
jgi:hypothetical protein